MAKIKMMPIKNSSNILAIGYDDPSRVLRVAFHSGSAYDYHEVPPEVYALFKEAPSYGVFFAKVIKGKFPAVPIPLTAIREDPEPAS